MSRKQTTPKTVTVPGFPNYQIARDGTIFGKLGEPLSPYTNSHGYVVIKLVDAQGKSKCRNVARLVAEAFVDIPDAYARVNRKSLAVTYADGNRANVKAKNLKWSKYSDLRRRK